MPAAREVRRALFHGTAAALFELHLVNLLLTLLTLGGYHFWGKTRVRRWVLGQCEVDGDRFAWHGTGGELLRGFVVAAVLFGVPLIGLSLVPGLDPGELAERGARVLTTAIVFAFFPLASVGSRRYRLSRTSWRGIRFSFRGSAWRFLALFSGGVLLTVATLGLAYPLHQAWTHRFLVVHSYFGQRRFRFDGRAQELLGRFLLAILLTVPTLGLAWFWYAAFKHRYLWNHTSYEAARFRCTVRGRELMNLVLGNGLLLLATLGLAWPWVRVRTARFTLSRLALDGTLDLGAIQQEARASSAVGDALSGFFGAEFDFG